MLLLRSMIQEKRMDISSLKQTTPTMPVERMKMNADIIAKTTDITFSTAGKPLELLYKSAIDSLNETLEPELGTDAIQEAANSGMDFSPEAVADRIVSFATGFFGAYAGRHGDESQNEQLDGFMDLIGGAIEKGFEEAREILEGLGVLQGDIASNVDTTYDLIQQKLSDFTQSTRDSFTLGA